MNARERSCGWARGWIAALVCLSAVHCAWGQPCMRRAAQHYQVPEALLHALAQQESGGNPKAVNHNQNGTRDIGLMQINSSWLPLLARHGLREADLWDPCVNTLVAAWLLSDNFRRWGFTYRALGAYHSPDPARQWRYAVQVLKRVQHLGPAPREPISGIPTFPPP